LYRSLASIYKLPDISLAAWCDWRTAASGYALQKWGAGLQWQEPWNSHLA
jgi:hypothetical protein